MKLQFPVQMFLSKCTDKYSKLKKPLQFYFPKLSMTIFRCATVISHIQFTNLLQLPICQCTDLGFSTIQHPVIHTSHSFINIIIQCQAGFVEVLKTVQPNVVVQKVFKQPRNARLVDQVAPELLERTVKQVCNVTEELAVALHEFGVGFRAQLREVSLEFVVDLGFVQPTRVLQKSKLLSDQLPTYIRVLQK